MAESRLRCLVAWATLRAFHAGTPPVMISCHSSGKRCRRSSASAIKARAEPELLSMPAPNSAAAKLQYLWCAVSAQLAPLLCTRQRLLDRSLAVGMMQIRPMRGQLDQSAFVHEHGMVRLCDQRQGGRPSRSTYLLLENAFTLRASFDSSSGSPAWVETSGVSAR
jgi:hypothetical protein